jgi:dihydroflavonol-4-reductase
MSNRGNVLLTGATGFVGSAVARLLCDNGYSVRTIARPTSIRAHVADLPIDFRSGDLLDAYSIQAAMADIQYVFHVAADYRLWARDPDQIVRNNVVGTRNVIEQALRARVGRIVYTSSVATLAAGDGGCPGDETKPLAEGQAIGAYKRSKIAAERLVERFIAERGAPIVIVNPSAPVGPRDVRPTPTGRIVLEAARGKIPGFVDTGLNLVHVDDVAAGHLAALRHGKTGERYILGGQNVALSTMLADIAKLVGRRAPRLKVPRAIVLPVAYAAEAMAYWTGKEPFATVDGVRMARHRMYFTAAKAERELGFHARPYIEGLEQAIHWFQEAGYLRG